MRRIAILVAATVGVSACAAGAHPGWAGFSANVDNPWLPLKPGTTLIYDGVKDGKAQRDVFNVTSRTKTVGGLPCRVIDDRVYGSGHLAERTTDYYSQDRDGNVWYVGEDTAELNTRGKVTSTEGTWHTGVNGAKAGLFMPAHPRLGRHARQEYYKGHAEDQFKVVSLNAQVDVPYRKFTGALETNEWTRLEPGVLDAKYYVRGLGEVFEGSLKGPQEVFKLVSVQRR